MQKDTITTTFPVFNPANLIIEQRNPNGKWRRVDLLMINELKFDDYNKNNYPVSTPSDAVQHFRGHQIQQNVVPNVGNLLFGCYSPGETGELVHIRKLKK